MKSIIYEISDSNMAGWSWTYILWLNRARNGRFTLTVKQPATDEFKRRFAPHRDLADGEELYAAVDELFEEMGYSIDDENVSDISRALEPFGDTLVADFRAAHAARDREW